MKVLHKVTSNLLNEKTTVVYRFSILQMIKTRSTFDGEVNSCTVVTDSVCYFIGILLTLDTFTLSCTLQITLSSANSSFYFFKHFALSVLTLLMVLIFILKEISLSPT